MSAVKAYSAARALLDRLRRYLRGKIMLYRGQRHASASALAGRGAELIARLSRGDMNAKPALIGGTSVSWSTSPGASRTPASTSRTSSPSGPSVSSRRSTPTIRTKTSSLPPTPPAVSKTRSSCICGKTPPSGSRSRSTSRSTRLGRQRAAPVRYPRHGQRPRRPPDRGGRGQEAPAVGHREAYRPGTADHRHAVSASAAGRKRRRKRWPTFWASSSPISRGGKAHHPAPPARVTRLT